MKLSGYKRLLALSALMGGASLVEDTATGNPVVFSTEVAKPLVSLKASFLPIQSSGTPSPENVLPITGWTGVDVCCAGKNLVDVSGFLSKSSGGIDYTNNGDGTITFDGTCTGFNPQGIVFPVYLPAGKYYFSLNNDKVKTGTGNVYIGFSDINNVDYGTSLNAIDNKAVINATAPIKRFYMNVFTGAVLDNVTIKPMLVKADNYADFEPYNGTTYPVTWQTHGTIYGGYVDLVTGEVWETWFVANFLWSDKWYGSELTNTERRVFKLPQGVVPKESSYYNDHKAETVCNVSNWLWSFSDDSVHYYIGKDGQENTAIVFMPIGTSENTEIQVGGLLATPVLLATLTPQQITALKGSNTIWSDANGDCEVTYLKKG